MSQPHRHAPSGPQPGQASSVSSGTDQVNAPRRAGLGTFEVAAISLGFMGPVMAMSLNGIGVAQLVGQAVPFTFAVAFVGTLLVAYAFIRLTGRISHAGSVYALAGSTLGPRAGFFGGFALLGTYVFFAICIMGACMVFFEAMMAEIGVDVPQWAALFVVLAAGALGTFINLRRSEVTARTLLGIGLGGILVMVVLAVVILTRIGTGNTPVDTEFSWVPLTPSGAAPTAILTAAVFGFLSWAGFESGTSLSEEARQPRRTIPRALLGAVVLGGVLYVFIMFAQMLGFGAGDAGASRFAEASSTLTQLSSMYIGPWFAILIAVIAFCVAFASLLSSTTAASRLIFALARDGFGPAKLASTSPKTGIPAASVWLTMMVTVAAALATVLLGATSVDVYYWYATIATLCMVVAYSMASVGVIRYALRPGSSIRMVETIIPVAGIAFLAVVFAIQIIGQEAPYTYFPWVAGAWCVLGVVIILVRPRLAASIGDRLRLQED